MAMITMIKKRDGRQVPFNIEKIASAIYKAAQVVGGNDYGEAMKLADEVCQQLSVSIIGRNPSVEEVQDMVEKVLIEGGHSKTAKAYILYRAERTRAREMDSKLMKIYEECQHRRRYGNGYDAEIRLGGCQAVQRDICP